jgi:hypothetical protein
MKMKTGSKWLIMIGLLFWSGIAFGQCDSIKQYVDEFDSTLVIAAPKINVGYIVPSNFQTLDGFKMIEEGKLLLSYSSNDSIGSFFLTLALAEREFQTIGSGTKNRVVIMTDSSRMEGVLNFSDKGTFDKNTNMRIYTHTCVIPMDFFYLFTIDPVAKIRVYYDDGYKRTIVLTPRQKEALSAAMLCLGEEVGLFPKKP